jgi:hypothetical protein
MTDWNIQSRARGCQACGKPFADKMPYYTLLFQHRHHLERLDVCEGCWTAQYSQGATDRKGFISFWQGVFLFPAPPAPEPIQKENAEGLLRKLCQVENPGFMAVRYILAVMLERKRILKVKAQTALEGQRIFLYEHARNGDLFTIVDPELQLGQLEEVQRQVADLLERGLDSNPSAAGVLAPEAGHPEPGSAPQDGGNLETDETKSAAANPEASLTASAEDES